MCIVTNTESFQPGGATFRYVFSTAANIIFASAVSGYSGYRVGGVAAIKITSYY